MRARRQIKFHVPSIDHIDMPPFGFWYFYQAIPHYNHRSNYIIIMFICYSESKHQHAVNSEKQKLEDNESNIIPIQTKHDQE